MYNDDLNNEENIDTENSNVQNSNSGYDNGQNNQNNNGNNSYPGYQNQMNNQYGYGAPNGGNNMNQNPAPNKGPGKNNNWRKIVAGAAMVAGIAIVGGVGFYSVGKLADQMSRTNPSQVAASEEPGTTKNPDASADATLDTTETGAATSDSVSNVVENVMPSIVSITTTSKETVSDYFGRQYSEDVQGSGSGIIIGQNSNEVLIATNNHVISGTDATVEIAFCDDKTVTGTVKGANSSADLAVVAVKFADIADETKSKIKVISIGDSDKTKVGEVAIAIGNALGYGQAVTVGHVSALNREIAVEDSSMTLMQTDAAINPGNSGGALLNAQGQLIGINSAKTATTEVEGMGYAIPISDALPIIQNLMAGKSASDSDTAYLGIVGQDITDNNSKRFNIPKGVYVTEVAEDSPAAKAGVKAGMVIVGFDGKEITTKDDLANVLSSLSVNDTVTMNVSVNTNGKYVTKELTVTLGAKSDYEESSNNSSRNSEENGNSTDPYSDGSSPYGNGNDNSDPFSFFGN